MRHDMWKVITDLPRAGSHTRNRKTHLRLRDDEVNSLLLEDLDDHDLGPRKFSMSPGSKHQDQYDQKSSTDRLNPLRRFLLSQVGSLWNNVHSEMSKHLDNRTMMKGRHFWTHVFMEVRLGCYFGRDGKIYDSKWGSVYEVTGFFVHPSKGTLCHRPHGPYRVSQKFRFMNRLAKFGFSQFVNSHLRQNEEWQNFRIVSDLLVLEKKSGGWFIHTFAHHEPHDIVGWTSPHPTTKSVFPIYFVNRKNHTSLYLKSSRQMGKKDLKKHKAMPPNSASG